MGSVPILSHQPLKLPDSVCGLPGLRTVTVRQLMVGVGGQRQQASRAASGMGMVWEVTASALVARSPGLHGFRSHRPRPSSATTCWDFGPGARSLELPWVLGKPWKCDCLGFSRQAMCLLQGLCLLNTLSPDRPTSFIQVSVQRHLLRELSPSALSPVLCFNVFTALWLFGSLLFVCGLRAGGAGVGVKVSLLFVFAPPPRAL